VNVQRDCPDPEGKTREGECMVPLKKKNTEKRLQKRNNSSWDPRPTTLAWLKKEALVDTKKTDREGPMTSTNGSHRPVLKKRGVYWGKGIRGPDREGKGWTPNLVTNPKTGCGGLQEGSRGRWFFFFAPGEGRSFRGGSLWTEGDEKKVTGEAKGGKKKNGQC